jgi:hypothetical protein
LTDRTCWVLLTLPCPQVLTVSTCRFNRLIAIRPVIPQTSIDHINVSSNLFVALTLFPYHRTLMVVMTGNVLISHQFIPYSHRDAFELVYQFRYPKLTIELLRWLSQSHYPQAGPIWGHPAIHLRTCPSNSISFKYRYKTFQCPIKIRVSSQVEQVINTSSVQKSEVGVRLACIHPLDFPHDIDALNKAFSSFILLWHTPWERRLLWIMRNEAQVAMHNIIAFSTYTVFHCPFFSLVTICSWILPCLQTRFCLITMSKVVINSLSNPPLQELIHSNVLTIIRQDGLIHFHMPLRC